MLYWAKISNPHMVDIGRALGHLTSTYVAFQSLDPEVLKNILYRDRRIVFRRKLLRSLLFRLLINLLLQERGDGFYGAKIDWIP